MDDHMPLRLCYLERTFKNNSSYQGRLKERAETGAELIGDDSEDADAEMIAMVIDSLRQAGLQEFQVELGQVAFYRSLLKEAGLEEEVEEELNQYIENKNYFAVEGLLKNQSMDEGLKMAFLKLPELFGSLEQMQEAKKLTANPGALAAIERDVYKRQHFSSGIRIMSGSSLSVWRYLCPEAMYKRMGFSEKRSIWYTISSFR